MTRSKSVVTLVAVATAAVVGATSGVAAAAAHPGHGTPVIRTAPATAPPASRHHGACEVQTHAAGTVDKTHGLVWARHDPTGVVSVWIPGRNSTHCHAVRRVSGAAAARRIAAAVEHAGRLPRGLFCPLDDGTQVVLYLTYASGADEYVSVSLSGCHAVGAPGRAPRESTTAIARSLKNVAPRAWASYF